MSARRTEASSVRQLQQLAAAMAHEVRNPLNSMVIHAELAEGRLRREGALTPADREQLAKSARVIAGEIERIDRILEEYLQYAGPEDAARRAVDAGAILEGAVARARALAEERGVRITVDVKARLGQWAVDGDAIGEALDAVLANALEASPRDASVEITASTLEDQALVVVRDRGAGISAEELPRIFHLGFSTRGRAGLGLTVAKQVVRGHGGSIVVDSAGVGQGVTVTLRLPLDSEGG